MVEGGEIVDGLSHEGVTLLGEHEVVGDANRNSLGEYDGICEERVEGTEATNIKIEVYTTEVIKDEVADGVCTLDGVGVTVESVKEPGVVFSDELAGTCVGPEFILAARKFSERETLEDEHNGLVRMHVTTTLGDICPARRKCLGFPGLVNDTRDTLYFSMFCRVPAVLGEWGIQFILCDVGCGRDLEIVGDGGENDDCSDEDGG